MTTERSNAYITKEDMEADFDRSADLEDLSPKERKTVAKSNAEKLKTRLFKHCDHRGGRMEPLSSLPHAVADRFNPPNPAEW